MKTDIELEQAIRASLADIVAAAPEPSDRPARRVPAAEPRRHRPLLAVAAASILVVCVIAVALVAGNRTDDAGPNATVPAPAVPLPVPAGASAAGELLPFVAESPAGFGPFVTAHRAGSVRTGSWVATAIGIPEADGYRTPITVSVFDGSWIALDGASTVSIAGRQFRSGHVGQFEVLATTSSPTIAASGRVERELLHQIVTSVRLPASGGQLTLAIDPVPDGFVEITPPRQLAADPTPRRTLAEQGGELGINEVSDWVDPLLYAASTAADIERHALGDDVAWSGTTTANPAGPLLFLAWSPVPGTVFEIVTTDLTRTPEDLLTLAAATSTITASEFDSQDSPATDA